jgi:hypothetical protein
MSVSHLKAGKAKDSAGVTGGVSVLKPLNPGSVAPSETSDSSAPGFSTQRIAKNPVSGGASKNGKNFDIC